MRLKPQAADWCFATRTFQTKRKKENKLISPFFMVHSTCRYRLEWMGVKMLQYIYSHVVKHVTFILSVDASDEQNTHTHTCKRAHIHALVKA